MGAPFAVVVMGVSGCGKSTVASLLARRMGREMAEADTFHSASNVAKMRAGTPLTDEDRGPWLDALADWIDRHRREGRPCVVACSALKRAYRERLARGHGDVRFVYLEGDHATVAARLAGRSGHYMPPSLLASQFATLEPPGADENPLVVPIDAPPDAIVERIVEALDR
ncbi:MAG TPA: gluconokinase [Usitatibacter sp.]|nr:gluconokinase [Usitatibacter sp.]